MDFEIKGLNNLIDMFKKMDVTKRDGKIRQVHRKVLKQNALPKMQSSVPSEFQDSISIKGDNSASSKYVAKNETAQTIGFDDSKYWLRFLVFGTKQRKTTTYNDKSLTEPANKGNVNENEVSGVPDAIESAIKPVMDNIVNEYSKMFDNYFKKLGGKKL